MLGKHGHHCDCAGCGTLKSFGLWKKCDGCEHPSHKKATKSLAKKTVKKATKKKVVKKVAKKTTKKKD